MGPRVAPAAPAPRRRGPVRASVAGHFGEFLQGRLGPSGPVALVTLPCPVLRAVVEARPGSFALHDPARLLPRAHAAALAGGRGRFALHAEMAPGGGAGGSTAARLALIAAAAALAGRPAPDPRTAARLCLAQEGASDPLMFPDPASVLWASRLGLVVAPLPAPPALIVVGGFDGPGRRTDPAQDDFADISDLAGAWAEAAERGDPVALARLSTGSALRLAARTGADLAPLLALADRHGALGIAVAHTGCARAVLFAPRLGDPAAAAKALRLRGLHGIETFRTGGDAPSRRTGP